MNFVSVEFFILVAVVLCVTPFQPHRLQNATLLLASYVFYGWWNINFLPLIIGISLIDYVSAIAMSHRIFARHRRLVLALALGSNLAVLAYYKYIDFLIQTFNEVIHAVGGTDSIPLLSVLLPIGISFHTFQSMSYAIDVYRGQTQPIRNLLDYQLYVSFFPQLVAGPIERSTHLIPQVLKDRHVTPDDIRIGLQLVAFGFFKKVAIADNLAPIVDGVYGNPAGGNGLAVLLATYAFAIQIYCDFSGYTDIARGTARLLGFKLSENFRQPYLATNPSDFWRRWHISLSSWLRDYLYIPLGGNRFGPTRTYIALMLTMLLGGLWHGAAWNFVLWGLFHGTLLIAHRLVFGHKKLSTTPPLLKRAILTIGYFHITCASWLLFRAIGGHGVVAMVERLFTRENWVDTGTINVPALAVCAMVVLLFDVWAEFRQSGGHVKQTAWLDFSIAGALCLLTVMLAPSSVSSFIYFQF